MKKVHVLDTSYVMQYPNFFWDVPDKEKDDRFVIPSGVIHQLDLLKKVTDEEKVLRARRATTTIFEGQKKKNVTITKEKPSTVNLFPDKIGNEVIATALKLKKEGSDVILHTMDKSMQAIAASQGIKVNSEVEINLERKIAASISLLAGLFSIMFFLNGNMPDAQTCLFTFGCISLSTAMFFIFMSKSLSTGFSNDYDDFYDYSDYHCHSRCMTLPYGCGDSCASMCDPDL